MLSACAVHELTDELPRSVHIAVTGRARPPQIKHPPVTAYRFDEKSFEAGVELMDAAPGEPVRVYSAPRTVVDMMRLRHRVGEFTALGTLRRYLQSSGSHPGEVLHFARLLGVEGPVHTAMDALLS
jgi:predicted transcriptional regulator of viral defense system